MGKQHMNRVSGKILVVLSFGALLAVRSGYTQPARPDEGTTAHIFQLAIMALVPIILLFLQADATHPAPVQGSDSGRAQSEAAGERTESPIKKES
jgi:hypothetical protein